MAKCDDCGKEVPDSFLKPYSKPAKPPQPVVTLKLCNDCLKKRKNPKNIPRIPIRILH